MDHQFRRGIHRPNAQRLSISLAPLVAQRSLLFRIRSDLASAAKTNYGEMSPEEESPAALYTLTPTASARLISAALSAISSCSVYSQDSWKPTSATFGPVVNIDYRRHAIAFSPSLQWSDLSESSEDNNSDRDRDSSNWSIVKTSPSGTSPAVMELASAVGLEGIEDNTIELHFPIKMEVACPLYVDGDRYNKPSKKLRKKKEDFSKRISRHSFGKKVVTQLSMSSKKEAENNKKTANAVQEYKLPELSAQLSPLHMAFIAPKAGPRVPPAFAIPASGPMLAPARRGKIQTPGIAEKTTMDAQQQERVRLIRHMPPPLPNHALLSSTRSTIPPPSLGTPAPLPARKGHRRYQSSPAVAYFDIKPWDTGSMPPMPPIPLKASKTETRVPPTSARPRALSVASSRPRPLAMHTALPPFPIERRHF